MTDQSIKTVQLSYEEVPWFRKRWFVILAIFLFTPITLLIVLTGDIYTKKKDGSANKLPKINRLFIGLFSLMLIMKALAWFVKNR